MSTIRDIAREAGVSIGTVSHVLNHPDRVAAATCERVQRAIRQLGWQPNAAAHALRIMPHSPESPCNEGAACDAFRSR